MGKSVSNMNVRFGGEIAGLAATFAAGGKSAEAFERKVEGASGAVGSFASVVPKLTGLLGGLGAAFSAASAVSAIKAQLDAVDGLAKLADRTGIATEQLVGLQHAADLSGVSAEELTGSVEKLLKNLAAATSGSKGAAAAFSSLGLNAAALINQTPNEVLAQVADALAAIENPASRAAATMAIFGKSGQGLLPLLQAGSAGIREAQAEVERLGMTISRADARKIEEANDAITRMTTSVTALAREFAVTLSPAIQKAADSARGLVEVLHGSGADNQVADVTKLRDNLAAVTAAADQAKAALAAANTASPAAQVQAYEAYLAKLREVERAARELDVATKPRQAMIGPDGQQQQMDPGDRFGNFRIAPDVQRDGSLQGVARTEKFYSALSKRIAEAEGWMRQIQQAQSGVEQGAAAASAAQVQAAQQAADSLKEQERRTQALADTLERFRQSALTAGMSDSARQLFDFQQQGASPQQLAQAEAYLKQIEASKRAADAIEQQQRAQEDMRREAERFYEATRTPAERYAAELERINELLIRGMITQETAQRAADAARRNQETLGGLKDVDPMKGPGAAIMAGSAESQVARFEAHRLARSGFGPFGDPARSPAPDVIGRAASGTGAADKEAPNQSRLQQQMVRHLEKIATEMEKEPEYWSIDD